MKFKDIILKVMSGEEYKATGYKELLNLFGIKSRSDRDTFKNTLDLLVSSGEIIKNKKSKYIMPPKGVYVKGTLQGHVRGFGFVIPEDALIGNDIFISASHLNGALDKDTVLVKIIRKTGVKRDEGEVFKILERGHKKIVGTFQMNRNYGFVVPDNDKLCKDIYIPIAQSNKAKNGEKVVVDITLWPEGDRNPEGKVIEVLGKPGTKGIDILSIIREYDFSTDFPPEVEAMLHEIPEKVSKEEAEGRRDLRSLRMVTIDGKDAKDLDDAVSVRKLENGNYELGVHIADVTHYVKEGTPLDKEAYARGTSVYLADRVIPMLPPKLSNGICSLNAKQDRLAFTCMMEINDKGKVVSHEIFKSVIDINERMIYEDVSDILAGMSQELSEKYSDLIGDFKLMEELALILRKERREKRGAIDFDFPESKIILDDNGKPIDVILYERTISHKIIEEFMLVANETVAELMFWSNLPFLYRVHEDPKDEKLEALREFVSGFGYKLSKSKEIRPGQIQEFLESIKGSEEENLLSRLTLRAMQQARYSAENTGHFGLAAKYYCHFTSPIRRYPDLMIHRVMGYMLEEKMSDKRISKLTKIMPEAADHTSERERLAERAERDTDDLKKTQYMADKVGETFNGIISSVTSFGFFVELPNTIEGLVRIQDLKDDYYVYDEKHHRFIGERTKRIYRLGEHISVKVAKVSIPLSQIDFEVVDS